MARTRYACSQRSIGLAGYARAARAPTCRPSDLHGYTPSAGYRPSRAIWACHCQPCACFEASQPDIVVEGILTPPLGSIEPEGQRPWQNSLFGISSSRRLARDAGKMAVGAAALDIFLRPESMRAFLDFYSSGVCSPGVYESPDLGNCRSGLRMQNYGDRLWRRMVIVGNVI